MKVNRRSATGDRSDDRQDGPLSHRRTAARRHRKAAGSAGRSAEIGLPMGTPIGTGVDPPQCCRSVRGSSPAATTIGEPIGLGIAKKELTIAVTAGVAVIDGGGGECFRVVKRFEAHDEGVRRGLQAEESVAADKRLLDVATRFKEANHRGRGVSEWVRARSILHSRKSRCDWFCSITSEFASAYRCRFRSRKQPLLSSTCLEVGDGTSKSRGAVFFVAVIRLKLVCSGTVGDADWRAALDRQQGAFR